MSLRLEREIAQWRRTKQKENVKQRPALQVDEPAAQVYVVPMDLIPEESHDERKYRKIMTGLANDEPQTKPWESMSVTVEGPYHSRGGIEELIPQAMQGGGEPIFDPNNPLKQKYRGGPTVKGLRARNGYTFRSKYT